VLTLQTARFLIKSYQSARKGENLPALTSLLARLKDPSFDPFRQGRSPKATSEAIGHGDLNALLAMFEFRSLVATNLAGSQFEQSMKRTGSFDKSWNECMRVLHAAATVHGIYFILRVAIDWASQMKDDACRTVLERLVAYYALSEMEDGYQWNGLLTTMDAAAIQLGLNDLASKLRNEMVGMVDSFDIADATLNSGKLKRFLMRFESCMHIYLTNISPPLKTKPLAERMETFTKLFTKPLSRVHSI